MTGTLYKFFVIKATSKVTGNVHYVKVDDDNCVELHNTQVNASLFNTREQAEKAMKKHCESEAINTFTVDSIIISLEETITKH